MKKLIVFLSLFLIPTAAQAQRILQQGNITTAGSDCTVSTNCVIVTFPQDSQSLGIRVDVGTTGTFQFEYTVNGTTWQALPDDVNSATSTTASNSFFFSNPGYYAIRVRASAITGSASTVTVIKGYAHFRSTATLTGGGGDGAILDGVSSAIKATVFSLTNSKALSTQIVDATGTAITAFGGGTQYANNSAQATPTGTVALGWDGANVRALSTNASGQQNVIFPSAQPVTQSGNWTVRNVGNAGAILDFAGQNVASPANSFQVGGQFNTTPTTITSGNSSPLQLDANGNLLVNVKAGGGAGGTSSTFTSAFPGTGTASGFNDGTNMQGARVFDADTGAGTQYVLGANLRAGASGGSVELFTAPVALADATANPTITYIANFNMCFNGTTWDRCKSSSTNTGTLDAGTQRTTLATNDPLIGTAGTSSAEVLTIQGRAAMTPVAVSAASGALASGSVASGAIASGAVASGAYASGSISDGADVTLGTKADAKNAATDTTAITAISILKEISFMEQTPASRAVTNAGTFAVQPGVATSGGATPGYYISAASNNSTNKKASAGQVYYLTAINTTATLKYIRLYDQATAPTCTANTNAVFYSPIPANSTTGAGFVLPIPSGMTFASGIGWCITGGAGDTDNTSTAAGDVIINFGIK